MRVVLASVLILAAMTSAKAEDLDAREIQEKLVGQTIAWWETEGWQSGSLVLLPGGKAEIAIEQPRQAHDGGEWKLHGSQICTTWKFMRSGSSKCYSVREIGPGHFVTSGGNEFRVQSFGV